MQLALECTDPERAKRLLIKAERLDPTLKGLAEAKRLLTPRLSSLTLAEVERLTTEADWTGLDRACRVVFSSPTLLHQSFAADRQDALLGDALEAIYVALLRTYEDAPAVTTGLRDSMPRLLDAVEQSMRTPHADEGAVLIALAALLHNPLLSHAAEDPILIRAAQIIDAQLSHSGRETLMHVFSRQPAQILASRFVRPARELLERELRAKRVDQQAVICLVRLLGVAHDANELARRRWDPEAEELKLGAEAAVASLQQRVAPLDPAEFHSRALSEGLDMVHDYAVWSQHGPSLRGSDWREGWSFCSEPWLLSPQGKVRLLQVEAMIKMGHSQKQARFEAFNAGLRRGGFGANAAVAPAASKRQRRADVDRVASPSGRRGRRSLLAPGAHGAATRPDDPPPLPDPNAPFLILRVRREHLLDDTLDALGAQSIGSLLRPLRVIFEGEEGIDEGGVRKEFFQLLTERIFTREYGMFEWHEDARTFWFSSDPLAGNADDFKLVGIVLGLAIHNGVILDLHLPPLLWQLMMNEKVGLRELRQIQPELHRGLRTLLAHEGDDVEDVFCADFTVARRAFGETIVSELVPNGANVPVTRVNRDEYVQLYTEHVLVTSVEAPLAAFRQGFLALCDGPALSLLRPRELEQLCCGEPHLDFRAMQANARYEGFKPTDQTVVHFWEVVHTLSVEDQKGLLFFVTGCEKAPVGGLGNLQFVLQRVGPDSMDLPTAHTCFSVLHLPAYTSRGKLRDRLLLAIREGREGFALQ